MKRFLVKVTCIATDNNPNFAGEKQIWYYGKNQQSIKLENKYFIDKYGYTRRSDAVRNYCYKNADSEDYWTRVAEIVEVEL